MALDPRPRDAASKPKPTNGLSACDKCGTRIATPTRFCPNCGARIPPTPFDVDTQIRPRAASPVPTDQHRPYLAKPGRSTQFFGGAVQAARAKLTLIRGDGADGISFALAGREHLAGRGECPISFPDDPYLSPSHANFVYSDSQLVVHDEDSLNGVFIRVAGQTSIDPGAMILVGEQVLTVSPAQQPDDTPDAQGTYYSASIQRPAAMEIRQHLRGGEVGWVFRPGADVVTVGREGNDINFPEDPFLSGRHAELRLTRGVLSVTDLGSRNGTFVRIHGQRVLNHGDYVFMGQQLLRVEIV